MTEYQFHWWIGNANRTRGPRVSLQAESHLQGAALALRHFMHNGSDISAPLAHVDMTEPNGTTQMVLVQEVLDWLKEPEQVDFIHREGLEELLHQPDSR